MPSRSLSKSVKARPRPSPAIPFKSVERRLVRDGGVRTTVADARRMAGVKRRGTDPELVVRSAATSLGMRYRLENRDLPGSPDLANRHRRWAIFVNGCFWHRHDGCDGSSIPRRNRHFWLAKFRRNRLRDKRAVRELTRRQFRVLVVWECESADRHLVVSRLRRLQHGIRC